MQKVEGTVLSIIFESDDSMYKVIKVLTDDDEEISVVGNFPVLYVDLKYEFIGEYITHPKFGIQLKVQNFKRLNMSKLGVISFLSSEKFKGIGTKTAEKIYDAFGSDCINKIIKDPSILSSVGVNKTKQIQIQETLIESSIYEEIFIELYNFGLTYNMIIKLYDKYKELTLSMILENPYRLIYEVDGFGFLKSDNLANKVGISKDNPIRIKEAILYTINYVSNSNGHVFLSYDQAINTTYNLLNKKSIEIDKDLIKECLTILVEEERLILEENRVYAIRFYNQECNLASNLINLYSNDQFIKYKKDDIVKYINECENNLMIEYTYDQKMAIINSLLSNISIITGGPGTGKTTIIKAILYVFAKLNNKTLEDDTFTNSIVLCAPTGRASKRMQESCGLKAMTIHKTLGYNFDQRFDYNKENKLNCNMIIVDESSMIDQTLANNLFDALRLNTKIIIVGDEMQLPSIGAGNILHDLILSDCFTVTKLTQIMRQSLDSDIIKLSSDIRNQNIDFNLFKNSKDIFYYDASSNDVINNISLLINRFIKNNGDFLNDLQILVPMYAGVCGIDAINSFIQSKFNDNTDLIVRGSKVFKVNDKVLQLQNDVILNIMNGDIGIIKEINNDPSDSYLRIDFDGLMVKYPSNNLDNLTLAYAISIHKSQGSEYKNVIMPIVHSYNIMLKRKLIYTAVTRAKSKLIIIGKFNALLDGVNNYESPRQTTLVRRLGGLIENKNLILDKSIPFDYLGEENMENITPYSFM